jgi:hypothetical protein
MKNKILQIVYLGFIVFVIFLAGFRMGQKETRNTYAEKFPHVENFQPPHAPAQYGDISLIGSASFPCTEPPCALMWNGKKWVALMTLEQIIVQKTKKE